jgi:putative Ca2+/H+ antiporter (TMEM165/GDT1 family)
MESMATHQRGERCIARGADISETITQARAVLAGAPISGRLNEHAPALRIAAATLLVMLDLRSLMDRMDSGIRDDGK